MLEYTDGDIKVGRINLHYYRTGGEKPPFILLHGAADNGLCWTPVAELLAERYDVIMPDAQGHGLSDRLDPDFTFMSHAVQTVGLMQELGITQPIIMGHSMGAGTAVNIAIEYPDLPKAIILEDPGWITEESFSGKDEAEREKQREEFMKVLMGYGKSTREEIIADVRKMNPTWSEAEIIPWAEAKLQFDHAIFSSLQTDQPSYKALVPKLKCPALLIISDGGLVKKETAEHASRLWQSEKPFRWVQIEGAGHNIHREQFQAFYDNLLSFLKDLP
jgi:N-formylmaleamate deformylase